MTLRRIVLATGNAGKLREFSALLAPAGFAFEPQSAFGIEPPEETGDTFLANALLKARYAARHSGLPAMNTGMQFTKPVPAASACSA